MVTDTGGPAGVSPWGHTGEARGAGGSTPQLLPLLSSCRAVQKNKKATTNCTEQPPCVAFSPRTLGFVIRLLRRERGHQRGGGEERGFPSFSFYLLFKPHLHLSPSARGTEQCIPSLQQPPALQGVGVPMDAATSVPRCVLPVPLPHPRGCLPCFNEAFSLINVPWCGAISGWFRVSPLLSLQCCDTDGCGSSLPLVVVCLWEGEQGGCCRAPSALIGTLPTPKFLQGRVWVLFTSPDSSPSEERERSEVSAPCMGARWLHA